MNWDKQYRYKMMGKPAAYNNEMLFLFKLTDFELFVGGGKRDSYLPKEWREYFGIPAAEHENSYKIDLADGYQVVKGDMFIHFPRKSEATCTLWPTSISFNKMALQTLNNCERIRIEINPKTKGMLLFPVTAQDKDGIRWTKGVKDPVARKIECKAWTDYKFGGSDMSNTTPTVIFIPPKPEVVQASKRQLRVAAYCRVSTDDEEQLTSYEAQKNYYTDKIMTIINYKHLYGYRKGADGRPEIIPEQAEIVRKIYDLFLCGTPIRGILEYLSANNIPNISGESQWAKNAVSSILRNEKYCGDVLLQKTYIDDCINKKVKKNTGQLPMYLVQNHHEGIISRETFDAAQAEFARRSAGKSPSKKNAPTGRSRYSSKYALSDRLYCGECGTRYQRCTWRNRDGSKRIVWRCVSRVDYGSKYCHDSPTLDEEPLHRAILAAINSAVKDKDSIIYNLKSAMEKELAPVAGQQLSLSEIDNQIERLNTEFSKVLAEASKSGDQAAHSDRFREIMQKQTALKAQRDELQRMLAESGKAAAHIEQCRQAAELTPATITEWDEALIRQVVESVTVETGNEIIVALKSGASIHQELM